MNRCKSHCAFIERALSVLMILVIAAFPFLATSCAVPQEPSSSQKEVVVPETDATDPSIPADDGSAEDDSGDDLGDEPVAPPEPEPVTASIVVTGDILMHLPVIKSGFDGTSYTFDPIFSYVEEYISGADYAVANLETTLAGTESGYHYSGYPRFNCPDAIVDAAKNIGFDMLLTANNHCNDTGTVGLKRTLEIVADRELASLGTVLSAEEDRYRIVSINGIHVGMICYTYGQLGEPSSVNGLPIHSSMAANINIFDYSQTDRLYSEMEAYIAELRSLGADAVVLYIHWGDEYHIAHNARQAEIAQAMCDLGVDVIIGGHPHVLQPVDLLTSATDPAHKTVCVYSTGNFISNQRIVEMDLKTGHTEDGMLFSFTLEKTADGTVRLVGAELIPTWVHLKYEGNTRVYRVLPLNEDPALWQTNFSLTDGEVSALQNSYDRTMAIVGDGMNAIYDHLSSPWDGTESE